MFWGGLRGSLSIALVLSLPDTVPARSELVTMVFGSVTFSLLVQGLSISSLLRWVGLSKQESELTAFEHARGRMVAANAALTEIDRLRDQGLATGQVYEAFLPTLLKQREQALNQLASFDQTGIAADLHKRTGSRLNAVKKARLSVLMREGLLSQEAYRKLTEEIDQEGLAESNPAPAE